MPTQWPPGEAQRLRTLAEAREHVMQQRWRPAGTPCPCCDQLAKVYARKLQGAMVRWLIYLARYSGTERIWVSVNELPARGGDYAKLLYWGMVECQQNTDQTKRTSGLWRPTEFGLQFIHGDVQVPSHVLVYATGSLGWKEGAELVDVHEALGSKFDYQELMHGTI